MNRRQSLLLLAGAAALPAVALAADTPQAPAPTTPTADATVVLGFPGHEFDFDLPADQPWIGYCLTRSSALDGTAVVTIQECKRTTAGWRYDPPYDAPAIGAFAQLQAGDAIFASGDVVNKGS